jgi:hypothetical protein
MGACQNMNREAQIKAFKELLAETLKLRQKKKINSEEYRKFKELKREEFNERIFIAWKMIENKKHGINAAKKLFDRRRKREMQLIAEYKNSIKFVEQLRDLIPLEKHNGGR